MRGIFVIATAFLAIACGQSRPVKTADGWKTARVSAARRPHARIGYSVRFEFQSVLNADRAEVGDWLTWKGCDIYQGGGSPGAPAYALCVGITDDASFDRKIPQILPGLDRLMADMDVGRKIIKSKGQIDFEAQRQVDSQKCDPSVIGAYDVNGTPYRCDKTTKTWEIDSDAVKWKQDREKHKSDLALALRSRVLTDDELSEVQSMGIDLFTREMQPYFAADVQRQLNEALLQQFRLRAAAKSAKGWK